MKCKDEKPATRTPLKVQIRWMLRCDMPAVLDIERTSFEFPWNEEHFREYLRQRNCIGMVAEHEQKIVGFMIYELHKSQVRILNFAVAKEFRRRGVGSQMVQPLVDKLSQQRREEIDLVVSEENLGAQLFFQSQDFWAVEVLHNYFDESDQDAYLMNYRLLDAKGGC
jgi:[ribosomal protein S18]-alanine N-acetyltransferase